MSKFWNFRDGESFQIYFWITAARILGQSLSFWKRIFLSKCCDMRNCDDPETVAAFPYAWYSLMVIEENKNFRESSVNLQKSLGSGANFWSTTGTVQSMIPPFLRKLRILFIAVRGSFTADKTCVNRTVSTDSLGKIVDFLLARLLR